MCVWLFFFLLLKNTHLPSLPPSLSLRITKKWTNQIELIQDNRLGRVTGKVWPGVFISLQIISFWSSQMWFSTSKLLWCCSPSAVIPLHAPIRRDKRFSTQPNIWMTMEPASSVYLYVWTGWLRDKVLLRAARPTVCDLMQKVFIHGCFSADWRDSMRKKMARETWVGQGTVARCIGWKTKVF